MLGLSVPHPHFASARSIKVSPPKIRNIRITPVSNGIRLTHVMNGHHPNQDFVFQSPAKMVTHLKRLEQTAWLRPMAGAQQAKRAAQIEDLGATP